MDEFEEWLEEQIVACQTHSALAEYLSAYKATLNKYREIKEKGNNG